MILWIFVFHYVNKELAYLQIALLGRLVKWCQSNVGWGIFVLQFVNDKFAYFQLI